MTTDTKKVNSLQKIRIPEGTSKMGRFLWHLVQMVLAMEAGMMIYHLLLWPLLAPTGLSILTQEYPLFSYWMMAFSMALGMIVLMRYHKSTWRYSLQMTTAMLAPLAALTVLVLWYVLPIHTLYGVGDPVMILAMTAFMLYRPQEHGGHKHSANENACHAG